VPVLSRGPRAKNAPAAKAKAAQAPAVPAPRPSHTTFKKKTTRASAKKRR